MHVSISRRIQAICLAAGMALGLGSAPALSQAGLGGPVSLVVAYAPGGATDLMARTLSDPLSAALGETVLVENRPGGGTIVGTLSVLNAAPDGRTLLYGTNATLLNQILRDYENYDPVEDLTPVAVVATQPLAVIAHPSLPADTIEELVAHARANPGAVNFASSGNTSLQHIAGEMLGSVAEIDMLHIPYSGAGPALIDLLAGRADIMITSLVGVREHIESGALKLLATTGPERSPSDPDVPTVAEAGYPGFNAMSFQAVFGPRDLPDEIVAKLNEGLRELVTDELKASILQRGMVLEISSPEEMRAYLTEQRETFSRIISETGIVLQ
ncbi:MAG: tripartite tricarboxylate transporter substrate binding protein [Rhodobacteraceae bacterium]|nr:tripartite tricarboxylate transporter substrate binding protein [Paracoccaceae bacterium]